MSIRFIKQNLLASWIMDAWQQEFETEMDPADGQWFKTGPGGSMKGLYGGLTDELATALQFQGGEIFHPSQSVVDTYTLDNRDGHQSKQTVSLTIKLAESATTTHAQSNAIKTGISEKISADATFLGTGAKSETSVSFEYSFSWSDTRSTSTSKELTRTVSVPMEVPAGSAYQAQLLANNSDVSVPYKALIHLRGTSEANFPGPIRGNKHFEVDAGTLCEWIRKHGSAGDESANFSVNPDARSEGVFALNGTLTGRQTMSFQTQVVDVTAELEGGGAARTNLNGKHGTLISASAPEMVHEAQATRAPEPVS